MLPRARARRDRTEPRERDSRQPPQRREEQEEKKRGLHSRTHARLQPPPPSSSSRSPLSRVVCTVTVFVLPSLAKIPSLASYLTTTHRIVFDTLDTQTTLISMLSALPLSASLSLSIKRTLNVVGSAEEPYVRFSLSALTLLFFRSVSLSLSPYLPLAFSVFLSLSLSKSSSQQPAHPCHSYCRRTHMENVSSM